MCVCVCVCLCVAQNELIYMRICQRRVYVKFIPSTHTHMHTHCDTHILIPFEDHKPTGLKVDIAYGTSASNPENGKLRP